MLADGNGEFTAAVGLEMDGSGFGLGTRSQRYAMVLEDGVVTILPSSRAAADRQRRRRHPRGALTGYQQPCGRRSSDRPSGELTEAVERLPTRPGFVVAGMARVGGRGAFRCPGRWSGA